MFLSLGLAQDRTGRIKIARTHEREQLQILLGENKLPRSSGMSFVGGEVYQARSQKHTKNPRSIMKYCIISNQTIRI